MLYGVGVKNGKNFISQSAQSHKATGEWSTGSEYHSFRHELGHALQQEKELTERNWNRKYSEIENIKSEIISGLTNSNGTVKINEMGKKLSIYGFTSTEEFIS